MDIVGRENAGEEVCVMTLEQLQALTEWVDARIAEKIEAAFNRDGLHEYIRQSDLYKELKEAFGIEERDT